VADSLIKKLGINPKEFEAKFTDRNLYRGLGLRSGMFFNKEMFGEDRLVVGTPQRNSELEEGQEPANSGWEDFLAKTPLSSQVQHDIARFQEARVDYVPGLSSSEKKACISKMSYRDFLLNLVKANPGIIPFYQRRTEGEWGVGIAAEPALDCWALGLPGFQGMKLEPGAAPNMSYSAAGYANGGSYRFHFPDGNASIARLLVRSLIPDAVLGHTAEDVVTALVDYARLDREDARIRLRLNSTVVNARNVDNATGKEVEVAYASGNQVYKVREGLRAGVLEYDDSILVS